MLLQCCTSCQVHHTKCHAAASYTSYAVDRALQMVDCCIIPVLSLFVRDSSCSNALPFVLCRYHCRYHRCKDVGRVATAHIPPVPLSICGARYPLLLNVHIPSIPTCTYGIIGDSSCSNFLLSFCAWCLMHGVVAGVQAGGIGAPLPPCRSFACTCTCTCAAATPPMSAGPAQQVN